MDMCGLRIRLHLLYLRLYLLYRVNVDQDCIRVMVVDMCWTLVAEEPHRSTILNLEHCPPKANVRCLVFPL